MYISVLYSVDILLITTYNTFILVYRPQTAQKPQKPTTNLNYNSTLNILIPNTTHTYPHKTYTYLNSLYVSALQIYEKK